MARALLGKPAAEALKERVAEQVQRERARSGRVPGLAVVLVGDDPASAVYVARKQKAALAVGFESTEYRLPASTTTDEMLHLIDQLNQSPNVHGILVQLPLPKPIDAAVVIERIDPRKDVDGLTRVNQGALMQHQPGLRPCTAIGIMDLLAHYHIGLTGRRAAVVGRSALVGLPVALLLMRANATVTLVHSQTAAPASVCREADLLVVAAGHPGLVTREWIAPGAVVVDVGINRTPDGLVGDVDALDAQSLASWATPVPGGVGPMTIAELMHNTWHAFCLQGGH